ncbi:insulin-like growth factor 1 receptor [Homarus americanus]|uniref:insulin-like growth factor 1 receptor n=1 Tax=Homarus americanus TaxID=6706 RepID=UPI001C48F782|nr:insulin-like growth factor 1 receptor [Homarus americanus]
MLASGAFATLSVGVVSEDAPQGFVDDDSMAPPPKQAALITVTAHEAAPAATRHAQLLASLNHENLTRLLGVVVGGPVGVTLVLEYQADAHLPEYLHARTLAPADYAHTAITRPDVHTHSTISVGGLVGVAVQVAAGMAFLESHRVSHTDLAARNVVVVGSSVKVTQVGSALPRYSSDYWRPPDGRGPAPLRWCSPEALCQSTFSSASDVWSFGVTLWEILTLARRRPHHHLSDDLLFHAILSTHAHAHPPTPANDTYATPQVVLSPPAWCPREVQEVMSACWRPYPSHRPSFTNIHAKLAAYSRTHD